MFIILTLALISTLASVYTVFFYAPTELVMGHIQRIFYFHMGTVWASTLAFILVFIASIQYLRKQSRKWDVIAYTSAELGVRRSKFGFWIRSSLGNCRLRRRGSEIVVRSSEIEVSVSSLLGIVFNRAE